MFLFEVLCNSKGFVHGHARVCVVDDWKNPGRASVRIFRWCDLEFLVDTCDVNELDPFYLEWDAFVVEAESGVKCY